MPRGFFEVTVKEDSPNRAEHLYLFSAFERLDESDLIDALKSGFRRVLYPDTIVIVCKRDARVALTSLLEESERVVSEIGRSKARTTIYSAEVRESGHIDNYIKHHGESNSALASPESTDRIFNTGITKLFEVDSFIARAPSGFTFLKPSGSRSQYFLRTEEVLFSTERVSFLAFALLRFVHAREGQCGPIDQILVDTMSISPLAYVLADLYSHYYRKPKPLVESFHSYNGIHSVPKPRRGSSLCIISASTSMSMYRRWIDASQCAPSEVIVLATEKTAQDSDKAVFMTEAQRTDSDHGDASDLRDIQIVGERFSPEDIPPREVMIRARIHGSSSWTERAAQVSENGGIRAFGLGNPNQVHVRYESIKDLPDFQSFVRNTVVHEAPISTKFVLFQPDEASSHFASLIAEFVEEGSGRRPQLILSADQIDEPECGVLIAAAVVGGGKHLLDISRSMRGLHTGARRLIVGFEVALSRASSDAMRSNLVHSSLRASTTYRCWQRVEAGWPLRSALKLEYDALSRVPPTVLTKPIRARIASLRTDEELTGGAFLPSTADGRPLALRPDFAFWSNTYEAGVDHSAAVLLTMADVLQNAREHKLSDEQNRLGSQAFQHVTLSPDNFGRFNDGVIQAAILRSSEPRELDYSRSRDASRRMLRILHMIVRGAHKQQGEAALEFAMAVFLGRIRFHHEDDKKIKDLSRDIPKSCRFSKLLRYFLLRKYSDQTLGF